MELDTLIKLWKLEPKPGDTLMVGVPTTSESTLTRTLQSIRECIPDQSIKIIGYSSHITIHLLSEKMMAEYGWYRKLSLGQE